MNKRAVFTLLAILLPLAGCQSHHAPATAPQVSTYVPELRADCPAPAGWKRQLLSTDKRHTHMLWLSPTGHTAYAIIHVNLPFPVGDDLLLWVTMREMKRIEGEATVLESNPDPSIDGLRFVAEGTEHVMHGNLLVRGFESWVIYAGTFRNQPVDPAEFKLAEAAREHTVVGSN